MFGNQATDGHRRKQRDCKNTRTGEEGRHHVQETIIRKALNGGIRKLGSIKRAACHALQYSFAVQFLESGYDIGVMKELLSYKDEKLHLRSELGQQERQEDCGLSVEEKWPCHV